ncbi:MAG: uroporphyrinogen-III C-methyltransferase [Candidatus Omnitrophota bacterium]|nr:uroporphyrinogen-III C-methyltransferase [Candidatus Omnitrophota bacterium]
MIKPTVYLVGAGPGDSRLITVKGLELIKKADCIIYDYLVSPGLLGFRKDGCKLIYAGKKAGSHTLTQDKINQLLVREAKVHSNVVRLKGGDPFIFGRGAEEASYLKKNRINFDIVPGITSAIAVPAYAGIPLTERSRNSTVGFITGHEDPTKIDSSIDWDALVKALGTMVFLMGVGNLGLIVKRLTGSGKPKNTPVALIRWGTTAKQKTVTGTLGNIVELARKKKITPPAIIVIGEAVKLRKELNWFEKKPLFAKRIIVTRTREQASLLSEKLAESGAEVIEIPTIKVVSRKADKQLRNAFSTGKYDWVFFTSQNGVSEFAAFLDRAGKDSRIFGKAKICAIGSETAKSLRKIGIRSDYLPYEFVAEAVVKHFKNMEFKGRVAPRALILRAKKARDILPEGLKEAGFDVKTIDLYDTVLPKESAAALKQAFKAKIDFVTFTSSSTVENFIKLMGKSYKRKLSGVKFASIGPVTSSTLKKSGLKADIEAKVYTIEGLVKAMASND